MYMATYFFCKSEFMVIVMRSRAVAVRAQLYLTPKFSSAEVERRYKGGSCQCDSNGCQKLYSCKMGRCHMLSSVWFGMNNRQPKA